VVKAPRWVPREAVLALHAESINRFGGSSGLRDEALLDSALARAPNLPAYGKPTLHELAAVYGFGIARNPPRVDGNKRAAFLASAVFLELNDYTFVASEIEVVLTFTEVAAGNLSEAQLAAWLKKNSRRRR
jgi:death on curing protein